MNAPHSLEVAADTDYLSQPYIAALKTRLNAMVDAADKPAAYGDYLRWYNHEVAVLGADNVDRRVAIAQNLTFTLSDFDRLAAFDDAVGGTVYDLLINGDSTTIAHHPPSEYMVPPVGARVRAGYRPPFSRQSMAAGINPTVVYINGMQTILTVARESRGFLRLQVLKTNWGPTAQVQLWYNPTIAAQDSLWKNPATACVARLETQQGIANAFERLVGLARFASCRVGILPEQVRTSAGVRNVVDHDAIVATRQLYAALGKPMAPRAPFVGYLAGLITDAYQQQTKLVFAVHSQGNLMVRAALTSIGYSAANPPSNCTAVETFASPIPRALFPVESALLKGMIMNRDILLQLSPPVSNDFVRRDSELSMQADTALSMLPTGSLAELLVYEARSLAWGLKIHGVDDNYLLYEPRAGEIRADLTSLYTACQARP